MLNKNWPIDKLLLFSIIQLVGFGTVMMYSASSFTGTSNYENHWYYLYKHLRWLVIGLFAFFFVKNINYNYTQQV